MIWQPSFSRKAWRRILLGAAAGAVFMVLAVWATLFFTLPDRIVKEWGIFPLTALLGAYFGAALVSARLKSGREHIVSLTLRTGLETVTQAVTNFHNVAVATINGLDITNSLGQHFAIEWQEVEIVYPTATHILVAASDPRGRMRAFSVRWSTLESFGVASEVRALLGARFGSERIASLIRGRPDRSRQEMQRILIGPLGVALLALFRRRDSSVYARRLLIGCLAVALLSLPILTVSPFVLPREVSAWKVVLWFWLGCLIVAGVAVTIIVEERPKWLWRQKRYEQLGWLLPLDAGTEPNRGEAGAR